MRSAAQGASARAALRARRVPRLQSGARAARAVPTASSRTASPSRDAPAGSARACAAKARRRPLATCSTCPLAKRTDATPELRSGPGRWSRRVRTIASVKLRIGTRAFLCELRQPMLDDLDQRERIAALEHAVAGLFAGVQIDLGPALRAEALLESRFVLLL